jgi:hypothetical protein
MLTNEQLGPIIEAEEINADLEGASLGQKRKKLMDYYYQRPYGDEVDGQSQVVTSEVADTVEAMLPSLMRVFAQGKEVAKFTTNDPEGDEEAREKTLYANWVFLESNQGLQLLHSAFKDALLQFTGTFKCHWDDTKEVTEERYTGMTPEKMLKLQLDPESEILEQERDPETDTVTVKVKRTAKIGRIKIETVPPEQTRLAKNATTFIKPRFGGQKTPKTRSELIQMGFPRKKVDMLPCHDKDTSPTENARNYDLNRDQDDNPTTVKANDVIMLGEYYMFVDVDEDGISELWQFFYAGQTILEKTKVDMDPYATCITIPMPNRAIGTCPAEQVADLQLINSTLTRNVLNNAYQVNYARTLVNERVDLDDLLNPVPGGIVRVDTSGPIGDSAQPLVTQPQIPQLLQAIEQVNAMREERTGITRLNQGLDADTLNQTATGFKGLVGAGQQKEQLIALMLSVGVKVLFEKIIILAHKHQEGEVKIKVGGESIGINPSSWRYKTDCSVQVGIGSGDRQEKIANLNYILQQQKELLQLRSTLTDQAKMYNTFDKLVAEVGLKDVDLYFNNPEKPGETLQAQNEQLMQMVEDLQAQVQSNPLAEAEQVKAQARLIEAQGKGELEAAKLNRQAIKDAQELTFKYDELETKENTDIPGQGSSG